MGKPLFVRQGQSMNRAQKQARRNITRKKAQRKKKEAWLQRKAAAAADLKSKKAGKPVQTRDMMVKLDRWAAGGAGHAGERALVSLDASNRNTRWAVIRVKSQSRPIWWVTNSWHMLRPRPGKKKAAERKARSAARAAEIKANGGNKPKKG